MEEKEEGRTGWGLLFVISECSKRYISSIICKVMFSETKTTSTEFLTNEYVNLTVL